MTNELDKIAREQKIPILLIADTYEDFKNKKRNITGGDSLKFISYCFAEVRREGSMRVVEIFKPRREKIYFRLDFNKIRIFNEVKR